MPKRVETGGLIDWLEAVGHHGAALHPLPGDVSERTYLRVTLPDGATAIAVVYPAELRDSCRIFLQTTAMLEAAGVRVPEVLASDCDAGRMLVEDMGPATLYDRADASWTDLLPLFEHAIDIAAAIGRLSPAAVAELNPPLDTDLLRRELRLTWEVMLLPRRLTGDRLLSDEFRRALDLICQLLGELQPVPCHRDFMARNLVVLDPAPELAVLDHQGLRLGPPLYDLASLLNDSLFPPPEIESSLVRSFLAGSDGWLTYHRCAVQRTLKAVGTFAAFARRGSSRHVGLIAPTLERSLHHLAHLPEGRQLAMDLTPLWEPWLERHRQDASDLLD